MNRKQVKTVEKIKKIKQTIIEGNINKKKMKLKQLKTIENNWKQLKTIVILRNIFSKQEKTMENKIVL